MKQNPTLDLGILFLRIGLGLIVLFYGCQKLLGVFGGFGFTSTITFFHDKMGIPTVFATLCVLAESFGAIAIIIGLLTRLAAVGLVVNFAVATYFSTDKLKLIPSIFGHGKPQDYPLLFLPLALAFMALAISLVGPGKYSIDCRLFQPRRGAKD